MESIVYILLCLAFALFRIICGMSESFVQLFKSTLCTIRLLFIALCTNRHFAHLYFGITDKSFLICECLFINACFNCSSEYLGVSCWVCGELQSTLPASDEVLAAVTLPLTSSMAILLSF